MNTKKKRPKKRPLRLCIKSERCSDHALSRDWHGGAARRDFAHRCSVAQSSLIFPFPVIRTVFQFLCIIGWPFFFFLSRVVLFCHILTTSFLFLDKKPLFGNKNPLTMILLLTTAFYCLSRGFIKALPSLKRQATDSKKLSRFCRSLFKELEANWTRNQCAIIK